MSGHNPNPDFGNEPPIGGRDYSWQERSLAEFALKIDEYYADAPGSFQRAWIDQVTPSGGKTVGSIKKAAWLIDQGLADYVVWVVPRNSIKGGFDDDSKLVELTDAAKHRMGVRHIRLDTELAPGRVRIPHNHHGAVITYQALGSHYDFFHLLSKAGRKLVFVFDEVHHGADDDGESAANQWGADVQRTAGLANCVIGLTGTPIRSDKRKVPFLIYKEAIVETPDGLKPGFQVEPSFSFTYADGMAAGIARKLIFEHFDPNVLFEREDRDTGEILESGRSRLSNLRKADAARLKNTALQPTKSDTPEEMLRRAGEACELMRKNGDRDAAILVVCADARSGDTLQDAVKLIHQITGETAIWVSSEDEDSRERIKAFKKGKDRWIVAKQMISEGTNLPRVRVIVMLKAPTQHLYWTQLIHRATRNEDEERLQDALVLQLSVDPLKSWAAEVEQDVLVGVASIPERSPTESGAGEGSREILRGIAASLEERSVMLEGDDYTRWDRPATKILGMSSASDRLQRHNVLKVLRLGEEAGEISLEKSPAPMESVFSDEEQAKRYWEEGLSAINQGVAVAARNGNEIDRRIVINQCKRIAGMGKIKIDDVMASHADPLKATKQFYEAARRFLAEMRARKTG